MNLHKSIHQLLGQHLLESFDSKKFVDWAILCMKAGYESESLFILGGLDHASTQERAAYFWQALEELGIHINATTADISYGKFIASLVLNQELTPLQGLAAMTQIFHAPKCINKDHFFHFHEITIELDCMDHVGLPIGVPAKIPIDDLEPFLRKEFELFLVYEQLGKQRATQQYQFCHNWEILLNHTN